MDRRKLERLIDAELDRHDDPLADATIRDALLRSDDDVVLRRTIALRAALAELPSIARARGGSRGRRWILGAAAAASLALVAIGAMNAPWSGTVENHSATAPIARVLDFKITTTRSGDGSFLVTERDSDGWIRETERREVSGAVFSRSDVRRVR